MATIVTRASKGTALTYNEVDANFTNLNSDIIAKAKLTRLAAELHAEARAARVSNPRNNGNTAVPPTVTVSASAPASPYVAFPSAVSSAGSFLAYCAVTGGWVGYNSGYIFPLGATRTIGVATGGGSGNAYQTAHRVIYHTNAAVHYVLFQSSKLVDQRLLVDGQYTGITILATAVNTLQYVKIDFGSASYIGRRIEFEICGGLDSVGSSNLVQFKGWYLAPTDKIWAPEKGLRVGVFGDSLTYGPVYAQVGATQVGNGWARILGDWLGIDDLMQSGLSGTGWLWQAGGTFPNMLDRVTDITGNSLDLCIIAQGLNDILNIGGTVGSITVSNTTIQARVTEVLTAIRAANPNLPIIVLGPWQVSNNAIYTTGEAAISAGVTAMADPLIAFVPTVSTSWRSGTGKVTATTGDGNADWMACSDNTHWTLNGHSYVGQRAVREVLAAVDSMIDALA